MNRKATIRLLLGLVPVAMALSAGSAAAKTGSFADDRAFLEQHTSVVVLSDKRGKAQVLVSPDWQGRVMTSTASGKNGASFGWINRSLIASGAKNPHINLYGGEDRFWLGPEGGQYSIFFAPDNPFDLAHWFVPPAIDTLPFTLKKRSQDRARFGAELSLTNYSGSRFDLSVDREVALLGPTRLWKDLGIGPLTNVSAVAYESRNRITNRGKNAWTRKSGMLSVWILGMFSASDMATIAIPLKRSSNAAQGLTTDYFGKLPDDRLEIRPHALLMKGDGNFRSKVGVRLERSLGWLGSYDAQNQVLTLVRFSQPKQAADYVNSLWKLQSDPFSGDVSNAYNDGAPEPGKAQLGKFYELESSSPAAALKPGQSMLHIHQTIHLTGPEKDLDQVARKVLGIAVRDIVVHPGH